MNIRLYQKGDLEQLARLLQETVNIVGSEGHTETQAQSWTPNNLSRRDLEEFFMDRFTIVAEHNGKLIGVAQMDDTGHINCFYCDPEFRRQGIGSQLFTVIEDFAQSKNISTIYTETSQEDLPFYLKMGFREVQRQKVLIGGEVPTHVVIEKKVTI